MINRINYGIIGFGRYAENRLFPAFHKTSYSKLVAISKRNINQAKDVADRLNISKYFNDPGTLLQQSDIDAVIIASPPANHFEHTILAAAHGKQVMVEKPFAVNQQQAETMLKVCAQNNVKLMAAFVMRFIEAVQVVRESIISGKLGELKYIGGYFGVDISLSNRIWLDDPIVSGGGVVADLGSHFLDLLLYLSGLKLRLQDVTMEPTPTENSVEKNALITLTLGQKTLVSLYFSFEVNRESGLTFHGSKGKLTLQNFNRPETKVNLIYIDKSGEVHVPVQNSNYYAKMIDHFSLSLLNNQPLLSPGEAGLENQKLIDKIYGKTLI